MVAENPHKNAPGAEDEPPEFHDAPDDIRQLLDDLGGGTTTVEVRRVAPGQARPQYLQAIAGHDFSLQLLADLFGGGTYQLTVKSDGKYRGHRTVSIDPSVKPKSAAGAASPEPARPDPVQTAILETLAKIADKLSAPPPPAAPPVDHVKQLMDLSAIVKNLRPEPTPGADSAVIAELRAELRALREAKGERGMDVFKTFEFLEKAWALKPEPPDVEAPGRGGGFLETLGASIAQAVAPMLLGRVAPVPALPPASDAPADGAHRGVTDRRLEAAGTELSPGAAAPLTTPGPVVPGEPQPGTAGASQSPPAGAPAASPAPVGTAQLAEFVFTAAAANEPVENFVAVLEDNLSVSQFNALADKLDSETWLKDFFGDDPRAKQHELWLRNLRQIILEEGEAA